MEKVKTKQYMVCVNCMTFNHANFIEDAMNGFCMQQTNFPFVCVIVDDASTDGEPAVIQKYIDCNFDLQNKSVVRNEETDDYVLTFAQHKTNKNCYFAVLLLKYNHYRKKDKKPYFAEWQDNAKYVALCEGDDYWIHPQKLQMQVDFLQNNHEYSMCFHDAKFKYEESTKSGYIPLVKIEDRDYTGDELLKKWTIPTASIVYRNCRFPKTIGNERVIYGDIILILKCATVGKIRGIKLILSVYRIHSGSLIHNKRSLNSLAPKIPYHYLFILDNFNGIVDEIFVKHKISDGFFSNFRQGRLSSFKTWRFLLQSFKYDHYIVIKRIVNKVFFSYLR